MPSGVHTIGSRMSSSAACTTRHPATDVWTCNHRWGCTRVLSLAQGEPSIEGNRVFHLHGQHRHKHQLCRFGSGKEDPLRHEGLWCAAQETLEFSRHQHKNQSEGLLSCSSLLPALLHRVHHSLSQTHQGSDKTPASPCTLHPQHQVAKPYPKYCGTAPWHTVGVEALITVSQLRWAWHVRRMANIRMPKAVF